MVYYSHCDDQVKNLLGGEPVHSYDFATARAPSGDPILGAPLPALVVSRPPSVAEDRNEIVGKENQ